MSAISVQIGPYQVGDGQPLLLIAGPCVIENSDLTLQIARDLASVARTRNVSLVFKASFDKANRTSGDSYRGVGMEEGLRILAAVRDELGVPVTTDIHVATQAAPVAEVCELLQIPAFLSRQTDLLLAAAKTGRAVHVKKGQFMAPSDMRHVVAKLASVGCHRVLLCERGTFFGYGRLVNDMRSLTEMRQFGVPVVFDATHSVQEPGGVTGITGGNRAMVPAVARAAMAVGIDGLFLEAHPDPDRSPSDAANIVRLADVASLLDSLLAIREAVTQTPFVPSTSP